MTLAFAFIASFFILSACWLTPLAGTAAINNNHSKAFISIAVVSAVVTGLLSPIL